MKWVMGEKTEKQKVGNLGEGIACRFLERKGFVISQRNYRKPWGEIDIISEKKAVRHFIEVKTVSRESLENISREMDSYRPEDNIHPWKLKRLSRAIQSYLLEHEISEEGKWQFDVVTVFLDERGKKAKVELMEDIVL